MKISQVYLELLNFARSDIDTSQIYSVGSEAQTENGTKGRRGKKDEMVAGGFLSDLKSCHAPLPMRSVRDVVVNNSDCSVAWNAQVLKTVPLAAFDVVPLDL